MRVRAALWSPMVMSLGVLSIPGRLLAADPSNQMQILRPVAFAEAPPLKFVKPLLPPAGTKPMLRPEHEPPDWVNGRNGPPNLDAPLADSVVQRWAGSTMMPSPIQNFLGNGQGLTGFTVTGAPPDTEGDVGPNHYIQWVNTMFTIFSKAGGGVLYGPANGNTLFASLAGGPGNNCAAYNDGDPLVLYDQQADRWFLSQFAVSATPFLQCVAVSKTGDPVNGGWWVWAFSYGNSFNDYGKAGVWPDGYYTMYNMFNAAGTSYLGAQVCAMDRTQMLAGNAGATQQCFGPNPGYFGLLPSHLNLAGTQAPPAGSPNYYLAMGTSGQLLMWRFHVDWTTPASSYFSGVAGGAAFSSPVSITVAAYTIACSTSQRQACVQQSGTNTRLEALSGDLMWRLNYRNFGDHESLVLNHSIDNGGSSALRWYEIRTPGTTPTVYQQGTFAPDASSRWMGSVNMDWAGNIAVGYSISSSSMFPSINYVGRLVTDTLGTLPQGETTLFAGTGSQTGTLERWGDYSTMSVDPVDGCTFWYTQEYLATSGTFNWRTRIGSFKFPNCPPCTPPGVPTGVSAAPTAFNQVTVQWAPGSPVGNTYKVYRSSGACPGGTYTLLQGGVTGTSFLDSTAQGGNTYSYRVSAVDSTGGCESAQSACASATATGPCLAPPTFAGVTSVSPTIGATCTLTLAWSAAQSNCGGTISYQIYRGSPGFTPAPANRIASDVIGSSYIDSSGLASGTTYEYIVRAMDSSNQVDDGNTVRKSASPYGPRSNQQLYSNGFETGTGLGDWTTGTFVSGGSTADWQGIQACAAHGGTKIFRFGGNKCTNSSYGSGDFTFAAPNGISGIAVPAGSINSRLSFYHRWRFESGFDGGTLLISTNGTSFTFVPASAIVLGSSYNGTTAATCPPTGGGGRAVFTGAQTTFVNTVVDLDAACNAISGNVGGCAGKNVWIAFTAITDCNGNDDGWFLDDVTVTADVPGSCSTAANDVQFFTARATSGQVKLEWLNPGSGSYGSGVVRYRTDGTYPTSATDGNPVTCSGQGTALGHYNSCLHAASNGTTYSYSIFVDNGFGNYSTGRNVKATPFATTGAKKWAYSTGATSLAPPGILPGGLDVGAVYGVSNDRILHGTRTTSSGGDWPRTTPFTWKPVAMNGPAQGRPPIVPVAVGSATQVIFLGSQDGHAYAFNAADATSLWASPPLLGDVVQAGVAAMLKAWSGLSQDLLFVGSRNSSSPNTLWALDPSNGSALPAWSFTNAAGQGGDGLGLGIISSAAWGDSSAKRVYFASRQRPGGSQDTVWCLSVGASAISKVRSWNVGDVDGAPAVANGRIYVGTNAGTVVAIDPASPTPVWTYSPTPNDGPVKGYIRPVGTRLYFSTNSKVWAIDDLGGSPQLVTNWPVTTIGNPSAPLYRGDLNMLLVGSSNGYLYKITTNTATPAVTSVQLEPTAAQIGSPAFDFSNQMALAGSSSGVIYGVDVTALP